MSNIDNSKEHYQQQNAKQILILGTGFAGVEVLKRVQKKFKNNRSIEITIVSKDNSNATRSCIWHD